MSDTAPAPVPVPAPVLAPVPAQDIPDMSEDEEEREAAPDAAADRGAGIDEAKDALGEEGEEEEGPAPPPAAPAPKLKAHVYDYESPNPEIRQRFKDVMAVAAQEEQAAAAAAASAETEGLAESDAGSGAGEDKIKRLNPRLTRRAYVYEYDAPRPEVRERFLGQLFNAPPILGPAPPAGNGTGSDSEADSEAGDSATSPFASPAAPPPREDVVWDAETKKKMLHPGGWVGPVYEAGKLQRGSGLWTCCSSREQFSMYCATLRLREETMRENARLARQAAQAAEYAGRVEAERRGPWDRQEIAAVEHEEEDYEDALMLRANAEDSTLNGTPAYCYTLTYVLYAITK
jgi:hypothetical protein